ncbi:MAG: DNA mismatch repair endonuclease MutL [bacterium]
MSKIHLLPQNLINQIAAGEVVERPASVLKELVENSIDAGASNIIINIQRGGIQKIQIIDDGSGMDEEDAIKSFERHATSKITNLDDLYSIMSYGFRGEALASIASVSKVTIETKSESSKVGTKVRTSEGKVFENNEIGKNRGTTINVEDLFYNVPARRKFLKSENTEKNHLIDAFLNIALVNEKISFELNFDGKNSYKLPARDTLKQRIQDIFKYDESELIEIKYESQINISGFTLHPKTCKSSKQNTYIFVNGRFIKDNIIGKAVQQSYTGFMPRELYPVFFIKISLNPKDVDVNVHPRKLEVKWGNQQQIFNSINIAVHSALEKALKIQTQSQITGDSYNNNLSSIKTELSGTSNSMYSSPYKQSIKNSWETKSTWNGGPREAMSFTKNIFEDSKSLNSNLEEGQISTNTEGVPNTTILPYINATQFLKTYILIEYIDKVQIIDQHAAAERITFDRLKKSFEMKSFSSQKLLLPYTLTLNAKQLNTLTDNLELFNSLGIVIEKMGPSEYGVIEIPHELSKESIEETIEETLSEISEENLSAKSANDKIDKLIATMACHHSIRGGDNLTREEINHLVLDLLSTDNPYSCPHGRPIVWELKLSEFEKKFGRSK